MDIEESVRIAIDAFNRFRRPDAEARVKSVEGTSALVEFAGAGNMDSYMQHFREKLEEISRSPVDIETAGQNSASFVIRNAAAGTDDPAERALTIIDKYYEGSASIKMGGES